MRWRARQVASCLDLDTAGAVIKCGSASGLGRAEGGARLGKRAVGVGPVGLALRRGGAALLGDRRRMHADGMRQRVGSTLIGLPLMLGELFGVRLVVK
jgi:hypothetical protein